MKTTSKFIALAVLLLSGCISVPDNRSAIDPTLRLTTTFDQDYLSVYETVYERSVQCVPATQLHAFSFPRSRRAEITFSFPMLLGGSQVPWVVEIQEISPGASRVDVISTIDHIREFVSARITAWVRDGYERCKLAGHWYPLGGQE